MCIVGAFNCLNVSVEFEAIILKAFFLNTSGSKVRALFTYLGGDDHFCLDAQCT